MAKAKAAEHEHRWEELMYVFPELDNLEAYEHEDPYLVEYCACGQRRSHTIMPDTIDEVRASQGWPPYEGGEAA